MDEKFKIKLCDLLNQHEIDKKLKTPDYVLTDFICNILDSYYNLNNYNLRQK